MKKLDVKHKRFADTWLANGNNGTQAAIDAGYSKSTAHVQASRLLNNDKVKAYIAEQQKARSMRTQIDADYLLEELAKMQQAPICEILDDNGGLKDPREWPLHWQRMVSGIEVFEEYDGRGKDRQFIGYTKKIKLINREAVIKMLGQHIGVNAFEERIKHSGNVTMTVDTGIPAPPKDASRPSQERISEQS